MGSKSVPGGIRLDTTLPRAHRATAADVNGGAKGTDAG